MRVAEKLDCKGLKIKKSVGNRKIIMSDEVRHCDWKGLNKKVLNAWHGNLIHWLTNIRSLSLFRKIYYVRKYTHTVYRHSWEQTKNYIVITIDGRRTTKTFTANSLFQLFLVCLYFTDGPGTSVGIATDYGLDGPGIEKNPGGGEIFRTRPDRPWGPPTLLYNGYRVFPGGKVAGAWC
jgi:hypothetical protein